MKELAGLPLEYGFKSRAELIAAPDRLGRSLAKSASKGAKQHARITPEFKENIAKALGEGKPATATAAEFGVSVASVNLIKKAAGPGQAAQVG